MSPRRDHTIIRRAVRNDAQQTGSLGVTTRIMSCSDMTLAECAGGRRLHKCAAWRFELRQRDGSRKAMLMQVRRDGFASPRRGLSEARACFQPGGLLTREPCSNTSEWHLCVEVTYTICVNRASSERRQQSSWQFIFWSSAIALDLQSYTISPYASRGGVSYSV